MRRWISVVVLVLVAMSLGRLITDHLDSSDLGSAPFVRTGDLGKPVHLEYADVTATGVRAGRYLDGVFEIVSAGVFLVVDTRLVATRKRIFLNEAVFVDAKGRRYYAEDRGSACSAHAGLPTGAPTYVMWCFDVPRDPELLVGGKLFLARGDTLDGRTRRDDVAEIDLGISATKAKELAASELAFKGYQARFTPIPTDPVPAPPPVGAG